MSSISRLPFNSRNEIDFKPTLLGNTHYEPYASNNKVLRFKTVLVDPKDAKKLIEIQITFSRKDFEKLTPDQKMGVELPERVIKMLNTWQLFDGMPETIRPAEVGLSKDSYKLKAYSENGRKMKIIDLSKYGSWNKNVLKTNGEKMKDLGKMAKNLIKNPSQTFSRERKVLVPDPDFIFMKKISRPLPRPPGHA